MLQMTSNLSWVMASYVKYFGYITQFSKTPKIKGNNNNKGLTNKKDKNSHFVNYYKWHLLIFSATISDLRFKIIKPQKSVDFYN